MGDSRGRRQRAWPRSGVARRYGRETPILGGRGPQAGSSTWDSNFGVTRSQVLVVPASVPGAGQVPALVPSQLGPIGGPLARVPGRLMAPARTGGFSPRAPEGLCLQGGLLHEAGPWCQEETPLRNGSVWVPTTPPEALFPLNCPPPPGGRVSLQLKTQTLTWSPRERSFQS